VSRPPASLRRDPRAHWLLLCVGALAMLVLLIISGYTTGVVGEHPGATPGRGFAPADILNGGPVLDGDHPHIPGIAARPRTIALTFDDGPSPWTPRILDVLERRHVPATFFQIGNDITRHTDVVRRIVRDGDEIGVHSFTHPELGALPAWRQRLELDSTQLALAAVTGYTTNLLRLPYSSEPDAVTATQMHAIERAHGYRVVLADLDTRDWARPGTAAIVAAATQPVAGGAIIMFHDGGGDRRQTVAALDQVITTWQSRGYTFQTVSHAIGAPSPWQAAGTTQRVRGAILVTAVRASHVLASVLSVLFILVGALSVLRVVVLLVFARRHDRRVRRPLDPSAAAPPLSIVVPAYNEAKVIAAAVQSLAASDYPDFEVIVVDDGSTDDTARIVRDLGLPGVRVIGQVNAGKATALNTGVAAATHDIVVMVDADTVFEPDTLRELVIAFAAPRGGAVSGNTKVGNRRSLLGRWQHIEYVMGFNLDRRMFDVLNCMPTVPGAIGAFRRAALQDVGGVGTDTLAEDTDLTMAVCRSGWRVVYSPTARAWTEAPGTLAQLWRQRYRWCFGTLQAMWKHRRAVVQRGAAGHLGRRGLPYLTVFQVVLPMLAPAIDVAALYGVVFLDPVTIGLTWLGFLAVQFIGAAYAFALDHESPRSLWALPLQQFVYRQLMYLVVIQSVASALYGIRLRWHKMQRTGDIADAPATVSST
jgi:cellulose synthase/poly-beta-1,6-N-acetylglucosamine synthase-like glycosyltransferase/peptidoglycan/xylan/chitin deacetylase (PgdA/CDA1 family)